MFFTFYFSPQFLKDQIESRKKKTETSCDTTAGIFVIFLVVWSTNQYKQLPHSK